MLKFVATEHMLKPNTVYNLGFCSQHHPRVDFDKCAKPTGEDSEILDLSRCNLSKSDCPDGLRNMQSCHGLGAPLYISFPHFLYGPSGVNRRVGLSEPVKEKHEVAVLVEPNTGSALAAYSRLQVRTIAQSINSASLNVYAFQMNIILKPNRHFGPLAKVKPTVYPLVWFETSGVVNPETARYLRILVITQKQTLDAIQWMLIAGGLIAIALSSAYGLIKFFL